ncbi:hypothetical protein CD932_05590 [Janthinobacterium sp. PC23-8]|nr:hypothetical protein CD932_05590 [Janthinobacterium sp. PC23-8]
MKKGFHTLALFILIRTTGQKTTICILTPGYAQLSDIYIMIFTRKIFFGFLVSLEKMLNIL